MKKIMIGGYPISAIIGLIVGLLFFGSDEIEYAKIVDVMAIQTLIAKDGDVIAVKIQNDGEIIQHSELLKLQGELDFLGQKGDMLVFIYKDNAWVEIGRRLGEK